MVNDYTICKTIITVHKYEKVVKFHQRKKYWNLVAFVVFAVFAVSYLFAFDKLEKSLVLSWNAHWHISASSWLIDSIKDRVYQPVFQTCFSSFDNNRKNVEYSIKYNLKIFAFRKSKRLVNADKHNPETFWPLGI